MSRYRCSSTFVIIITIYDFEFQGKETVQAKQKMGSSRGWCAYARFLMNSNLHNILQAKPDICVHLLLGSFSLAICIYPQRWSQTKTDDKNGKKFLTVGKWTLLLFVTRVCSI